MQRVDYCQLRKKTVMKNCKIFISALLTSVIMLSCSGGGDSVLLPTITGAAYDLLVVGDARVWKDSAGQVLFDVLDEDVPGLPQSEPQFNISFIPSKEFSSILRPARNILLFSIDDKMYTQGKVSYARNRWAKPQAIVQITAPNQSEMMKVVTEKATEIVDFLVDAECARSLDFFRRYANNEGRELIRKELNVNLSLPDFMNKYKVGENFVWISNGSLDSRLDLVVYRTPYKGPDDFKQEHLLMIRDSVLKVNVPGPSDGSYMTTEVQFFKPLYREFMFEGKYCAELRGLWRVEGDIMGGPFVSRSYYDEARQEIVTAEAFVYAPQHKKRNKMRQIESILRSVEIN